MKKTFLIILLFAAIIQLQALTFLAKDGIGLKTYPADMRSKTMGLLGLALTGEFHSSPANPASLATQRMIVLSFGETASSVSLSYERFSGFSADETSLESPYLNIVFPLPIKNAILSAYYYSPLNSYFQGSFTHEYPHPDGVSGDIHDSIGINYFKNFNIIGLSAAYSLSNNVAFSLGFECLFGNDKTEYTVVNQAFTDTTTYATITDKMLGYVPKLGASYTYADFSFGTTYRPSSDVAVSHSYNDTVSPDTNTTYPSEIAFGVAYNGKKYSLGIEYGIEKWSETLFTNYGITEDLSRIGVGGEYLLSINWHLFSEKEKQIIIPLRAGYYNQTGLYRNGKESAVSFGTSIKPFKSGNAVFDIMVSFGSREMDLFDAVSGGIESRYTEDFVTFGVSFTAKDLWFREKKK